MTAGVWIIKWDADIAFLCLGRKNYFEIETREVGTIKLLEAYYVRVYIVIHF